MTLIEQLKMELSEMAFTITVDGTPYLTTMSEDKAVVKGASGLFPNLADASKAHFSEKYEGLWMDMPNYDTPYFLYITHDGNTITFERHTNEKRPLTKQLLVEALSLIDDAYESIGYEVLKPFHTKGE